MEVVRCEGLTSVPYTDPSAPTPSRSSRGAALVTFVSIGASAAVAAESSANGPPGSRWKIDAVPFWNTTIHASPDGAI